MKIRNPWKTEYYNATKTEHETVEWVGTRIDVKPPGVDLRKLEPGDSVRFGTGESDPIQVLTEDQKIRFRRGPATAVEKDGVILVEDPISDKKTSLPGRIDFDHEELEPSISFPVDTDEGEVSWKQSFPKSGGMILSRPATESQPARSIELGHYSVKRAGPGQSTFASTATTPISAVDIHSDGSTSAVSVELTENDVIKMEVDGEVEALRPPIPLDWFIVGDLKTAT